MNKKEHRMIFLANGDLFKKVKILRKKYQLNISAFIRNCLEKKFEELEKNSTK
jgi:hypothetical protein